MHSLFYKVMQTEKWAVFGIFMFIILIATFNLIGSLTMLILDKGQDIKTLWSMGADLGLIRRIFFMEGLLINGVGVVLGLAAGIAISFGQIHFGWIRLGNEGAFIIDTYPVEMKATDALLTFFVVSLLGSLAAYLPVRQLSKKYLN